MGVGLVWRRDFFGREEQALRELCDIFVNTMLNSGGDKLNWVIDPSNNFLVKLLYVALCGKFLPPTNSNATN